jgi:lysozyme
MIDVIKKFEGLRLKAYKCPAGVYTIGYGHTENVCADSEISELMADQILRKDLEKFEQAINDLDLPLLQCEFDALVSFVFNVGIGNFNKSTLKKLLLQKKFFYAAKEFDKWVFAGGKKLPGLQNRRNKERKIFEGRYLEDYQDNELNSLIENLSDDLKHSKSEIKKSESTKRKYIAVNRQRTNKNCVFLAIKEHVLDLLSGVPKRNSKISYFSLFFCKIIAIIYKSAF